jgi:hypothetical protein
MFRYAVPFPVAPGKSEEDVKTIPAFLRANMDQYRDSRRQLGTAVERFYTQATPMGPIVIAYLEGERSLADGTQVLIGSELDLDRRFIQMVAETTGVDLREPPAGPPPETVAEWIDPQVTTRKKGLGFVAPFLPGKMEAARAFAREAFEDRKAELTESRKALGQNLEVVTLTSTPMGDFMCVYVEGGRSRRRQPPLRGLDPSIRPLVQGPPEGVLPGRHRLQPAASAGRAVLGLRRAAGLRLSLHSTQPLGTLPAVDRQPATVAQPGNHGRNIPVGARPPMRYLVKAMDILYAAPMCHPVVLGSLTVQSRRSGRPRSDGHRGRECRPGSRVHGPSAPSGTPRPSLTSPCTPCQCPRPGR